MLSRLRGQSQRLRGQRKKGVKGLKGQLTGRAGSPPLVRLSPEGAANVGVSGPDSESWGTTTENLRIFSLFCAERGIIPCLIGFTKLTKMTFCGIAVYFSLTILNGFKRYYFNLIQCKLPSKIIENLKFFIFYLKGLSIIFHLPLSFFSQDNSSLGCHCSNVFRSYWCLKQYGKLVQYLNKYEAIFILNYEAVQKKNGYKHKTL